MLKIGLTGGIGCGKSTISTLFEQCNVPIIDADKIAHDLVNNNALVLNGLVNLFGLSILNAEGKLNRAKLRKLIFHNTDAKKQLESFLHPLIFKQIDDESNGITHSYCLISIPLLFETNANQLVNRILVIDCSVKTQIERVMKRDKTTQFEVEQIINAQVSRQFRQTHANDLISNQQNPDKLAKIVKKLNNFYSSFS